MRHGLKLPSRTPEARVQQRLANIENVPPANRAAPVQSDGGRSRIITGSVDTAGAGSIVRGTGLFTIVRNGVGDVTITFTTAFSGTPEATATTTGLTYRLPLVASISPTTVRIALGTIAGANVDGTFGFHVIGPA